MDTASTILDPSGGVNGSGVRAHNERLVLSLVRCHGALSRAEIARRTRLSAQAVGVIVAALERDGLMARGKRLRGRVGQPSVPIRLAPDGAFGLGLKIGRRSAEFSALDFAGHTRFYERAVYAHPVPGEVVGFAAGALARARLALSVGTDRVAGIGVAAPFQMWNWLDKVGVSMEAWRAFDLAGAVAEASGLPVTLSNDATAACAAEQMFGRGRELADFAYLFVGYFAGGGVVLNHAVHAGRTGNAGAMGSLPIGGGQLIDHASLHLLEARLRADGLDPLEALVPTGAWSGFEAALAHWLETAGRALAQAAVAACCVIDFPAVVIDGNVPPHVRAMLVEATRRHLARIDRQGIEMGEILEGTVGAQARVRGAAALPLAARYLVDESVLFRT